MPFAWKKSNTKTVTQAEYPILFNTYEIKLQYKGKVTEKLTGLVFGLF